MDIDGTLADVEHRVHHVQQEPKDWKSFNSKMEHDVLNIWCRDIIAAMAKEGLDIILLTGRGESRRKDTEVWLAKHEIGFNELFMRPKFDSREDFVLKKNIYQDFIKEKYDVLFVIEDRLSVVKMWRELGLVCLQCDWGEF